MIKRFGHKGLVLGAVLCVLAWAGSALAAGYEVRLPVEKTVRLAPPQETPVTEAPKDATPVLDEKKAAPAPKSVKPEALKPEPAPKAAKPEPAPKAETAKPKAEAARPRAVKPKAVEPKAVEPAPKPEEPAPAPVPKPEPKIDPLALETPPAPAPHEPLALPAGGNFVGDLDMEFQPDHLILRVATNGPVEQVTSFGVKVPRKLAVDLRGPWRKKGPSVLRFATGPVKNVVVGEHPDRLRLAVEFREGAVAPDMQPKVERGERGVTVTIPLALGLKP